MRKGAFAILDCLGFKGIWRNKNVQPEDLVRFLHETKASAEGHARVSQVVKHIYGDQVNIHVAFVSDTVVVSAQFHEKLAPPEIEYGYLVMVAVAICREVQRTLLGPRAPTPLAMRGCIAFGDHVVFDSFYAGPAVDEAASFAEVSQGAYIWLTPGASDLLARYSHHRAESMKLKVDLSDEAKVAALDHLMGKMLGPWLGERAKVAQEKWAVATVAQKVKAYAPLSQLMLAYSAISPGVEYRYQMPLRTGGSLIATVVNPFLTTDPVDVIGTYDRMLSSFDNSTVDVIKKRENTEAFLVHARGSAIQSLMKRNQDASEPAKMLDQLFPHTMPSPEPIVKKLS